VRWSRPEGSRAGSGAGRGGAAKPAKQALGAADPAEKKKRGSLPLPACRAGMPRRANARSSDGYPRPGRSAPANAQLACCKIGLRVHPSGSSLATFLRRGWCKPSHTSDAVHAAPASVQLRLVNTITFNAAHPTSAAPMHVTPHIVENQLNPDFPAITSRRWCSRFERSCSLFSWLWTRFASSACHCFVFSALSSCCR